MAGKIGKVLILAMLILTLPVLLLSSYCYDYDANTPKDLNPDYPMEGNLPSTVNNATRETRRAFLSTEAVSVLTGTRTLTGTQTIIIGTSTNLYTITVPSASSVSSGTITKQYLFFNRNTGTMTVSIPSLLGTPGTITISGSESAHIISDGTTWIESLPGNAYNAEYLDGFDSTYFAVSTKGVTNGDSHDHSGGDGAQIDHTTLSNIGTNSHSDIDTHIADTSDPHGSNLTQTNIEATTGTITTAHINTLDVQGAGTITGKLGVNGLAGVVDDDIPDTITLTNINQITNRALGDMQGTIHFGTQTTGLLSLGTQTTGSLPEIVTKWRVDATEGTGTINFASGAGITLTPVFTDGVGTITIEASGTASAGGWVDIGGHIKQGASTDFVVIDIASILSGTGTLSGVASPYIAQINGTATGLTLNEFSATAGTVSSMSGTDAIYTGIVTAATFVGSWGGDEIPGPWTLNGTVTSPTTITDVVTVGTFTAHPDSLVTLNGTLAIRGDGDIKFKDNSIQKFASEILTGTQTVNRTPGTSFSTSFTSVPDIAVTVTPKSANSKFLLMANISFGITADDVYAKFQRGGGDISGALGVTSGSRFGATAGSVLATAGTSNLTMFYLDTPNTASPVTYNVVARTRSGTAYFNQASSDSDSTSTGRTISTLTVIEIQ